MTPLRQRMLQDLRRLNYSPHTIRAYLSCVASFARHFGKSPNQLGPEHIREHQIFLVEQRRASWSLFNQTVCALRFLYRTTLGKDWMVEHIPYPRSQKKLPTVLSAEEVLAILEATGNLKHRAIMMTIYSTGVRVSEVVELRLDDIDSSRNLERLPGAMKEVELPDGTVAQYRVYSPHSLRATTATLLLDAGVDIAKVQHLLGHKHITTTQIYDKRRRATSESASHDVPI